jgi:SSS family solute:Na+ symporter
MAAITLVVVAFFFLPKFLGAGIYTIPEFLEYRYDHVARTIMSLLMMLIYLAVTIPAVIYSGALTVDVLFHGKVLPGGIPINVASASWIIGVLGAVYVLAGGLKACAWADLLQGSALIAGGAIILVLAMRALGAAEPAAIGLSADMAQAGAIQRFRELNDAKLHMVLPRNDLNVPWTALVIGLWIPNFYYWGLNQYITQRTLGSKSLNQGQKGIIFAAALKLIIPFIIVIPGIIAFNLFKPDMKEEAAKNNKEILVAFDQAKQQPAGVGVAFQFKKDFEALHPETAKEIVAFNSAVAGVASPEGESLFDANTTLLTKIAEKDKAIDVQKALIGYQYDSAFGLLMKRLVPQNTGLRGFILAALLGAVTSTLAAMLNAASTVFTMDLYKQYLHKTATQRNLVQMGRICVAIFVVLGCIIAPLLGHPRFGGIFKYIQEFQGFVSPGILGIFIFGLLVHRAPKACGTVGLLLSPVLYGLLMLVWPSLAFLDRMAVAFACVMAVMAAMTVLKPLPRPVTLPVNTKISMESSISAKLFGALVVLVTLALYAVFW